jgi:hypothetical protein
MKLGRGNFHPAALFSAVDETITPHSRSHVVQEMDFPRPTDTGRSRSRIGFPRRIIRLPFFALRDLGTNPSLRVLLLAVSLITIWATLRAG